MDSTPRPGRTCIPEQSHMEDWEEPSASLSLTIPICQGDNHTCPIALFGEPREKV